MSYRNDLGYEGDDAYCIRHVTDGRTTIVQIVYRDTLHLLGNGPSIIAQGMSRRRKTDPRNPSLGSALAFMRAHQNAVEYYRNAVEGAMEGTLADQMHETELKVLAQQRKEAARKAKDARRKEARDRFERNGGGSFVRRLLGREG